MTEFNLSDKIRDGFRNKCIPVMYVREFIKILKEEIEYIDNRTDGLVDILSVKKLITKRAGDKLTSCPKCFREKENCVCEEAGK